METNLMLREHYDQSYYEAEGAGSSLQSASVVVPIVTSLVRPLSVIDVGCGSGVWLKMFQQYGAERILGLDGYHIDPAWLSIPKECFRAVDLNKPIVEDQTFDLAVSLEVAEHLPKKYSAQFVRSLVQLAPIVLFSAAMPFQGGERHINEQWPEFWRDIFDRVGYEKLDLIRGRIWKNSAVKYWYRQNISLFVRKELIPSQPQFLEASRYADDLTLVHTSILHTQLGVRSILRNLPKIAWAAGVRRLRGQRKVSF